MADTEGKKLTELRVIDLKTELEKRGLDKTGNKAALLERLAKAISEEGNDPAEVLIVPSIPVNKTPAPKKTNDLTSEVENQSRTTSKSESEQQEMINNYNNDNNDTNDTNDTNDNNDNNDNIENNDSNDVENYEHNESNPVETTEELIINISAQPEELDMDYQENDTEPEKDHQENGPEYNEELMNSEPNQEENSNVSTVETNGVDNEDSINLTIGEDEENLLTEESESNDKLKADGDNKKKSEESDNSDASNTKKGDSKESGKAESVASDKEESSAPGATAAVTGTSSPAGVKSNKQDGDGNKSSDSTTKAPKKEDSKEKSSSTSSSRNLWVSGLSSTTRATDLKQIFSKYGKVFGAKVVTNARTPGARCYGYVTLSSSEDAEKCIQNLHKTELHGRVISVEKAKGDSQQRESRKPAASKPEKKDEKDKPKESETNNKEDEKQIDEKKEGENKEVSSKEKKEPKTDDESTDREKRDPLSQSKDGGSVKDCDTQSNKSSGKKSDHGRGSSREDKKRSWDRTRSRSKSRDRTRRDNVLSFDKIKEERERQRNRDKERQAREEKRRQFEDMKRKRDIEREAARLEREREKLRLERERIEQEKAELLRLERERQKLEREKLERDRQELKRQQQRLEENRRAPPPAAPLKRSTSDRREPRDPYSEPERKRMATDRIRHNSADRSERGRPDVMERVERRIENSRYDARKEGPPPKSFKSERGGFSSRGGRDGHFESSRGGRGGGGGGRGRDTRPPPSDHRLGKDRYERPSAFVRDREPQSHRGGRDTRYDNSKPNNPRDTRYDVGSRPTGWQSGPPKQFNSANNRNNDHSGWNSRSSETRVASQWNRSENVGGSNVSQRSQVYQSQPAQYMSQNSSSYARYDPYKGSMQNVRKYQ